MSNEQKIFWAWTVFLLLIAGILITIFSITTGLAAKMGMATWGGNAIGLILTVFVATTVFFAYFKEVPEKEVWLIEFFGQFCAAWKAGPHFLIPWAMNIRKHINMADEELPLFRNGDDLMAVEFADYPAPVDANCFIRVTNPVKAGYNIDNYRTAITDLMNATVASFLNGFRLDQASTMKAQFTLPRIVLGLGLDTSGPLPNVPDDNDWQARAPIKNVIDDWGVEIFRLVISDVVMPESITVAKEAVVAAEADVKRAKAEAEAKIIAATALRDANTIIGQSLAARVRAVADGANLSPQAAADLVKWELLAASPNKVIVTGEAGGQGARLGAGMDGAKS